MEIDRSTAHTGRNSLKIVGITATGFATHTVVYHELVPAETDKIFTIAFWAKVDAEQGQNREASIYMQAQNDAWPGSYSKDIILDSTEWKEYTDTFEIVSDDEIESVWVGLAVAQSDVDFWIDDFRFFEGELSDEIGDSETAVTPVGRISVVWGYIKALREN